MNRLQRLIQQRVDELDISHREAARRSDISWSTWQSRITHDRPGRQIVDPDDLQKISRGLGISLDVLMRAASEAAGYQTDVYSLSAGKVVFAVEIGDELPAEEKRRLAEQAMRDLQRMIAEWEAEERTNGRS